MATRKHPGEDSPAETQNRKCQKKTNQISQQHREQQDEFTSDITSIVRI